MTFEQYKAQETETKKAFNYIFKKFRGFGFGVHRCKSVPADVEGYPKAESIVVVVRKSSDPVVAHVYDVAKKHVMKTYPNAYMQWIE